MQQQCSRDGAKSSILSSDRVEHLVRRPDDVHVNIVNGDANLIISTLGGHFHFFFSLDSAFHRKLSAIVAALDDAV